MLLSGRNIGLTDVHVGKLVVGLSELESVQCPAINRTTPTILSGNALMSLVSVRPATSSSLKLEGTGMLLFVGGIALGLSNDLEEQDVQLVKKKPVPVLEAKMSSSNDQAKRALAVVAATAASLVVGYGLVRLYYAEHAWGTRNRKGDQTVTILPGAKPIYGHLPMVINNIQKRLEWRYELYKEYGLKPLFVSTINRNVIMTFDWRDVEHVMKDPYKYIKGGIGSVFFYEFLGHGIFVSDGDDWKIQRKTASNIFNIKNFRDEFCPIFEEESKLLVSHIENARQAGAIFDLQDILLKSTIDSFALLAMGTSVGAMKVKGEVHDGLYSLPEVTFMTAFDKLNELCISRGIDPMWKVTQRLNGRYDIIQGYKKTVDDFCLRVIAEKKAQRNKPTQVKRRMDLLDFFFDNVQADGADLSDEYLRDVIMNFIIAGRDTTAQTLSWAFWRLAKAPEIMKQLREEIRQVLGDGPCSYEHLKDLKFANAVFLEALRLDCNVPTSRKMATEDDYLPSGAKVYKGDFVEWSSYVMGKETELWGDDAMEFKPSRWIDQEGRLVKINQYKYPQFNCGPRICLGMNMAQQEGMIFMCAIVQRYNLELVGEDDPKKWGVWNEDPAKRQGRYNIAASLGMRHAVHFKVNLWKD
ncbi:hypothetical protein SmJEL517_g04515 [Synchytrium microbalum]|uniref:Cytochrome P450 n=1 Tax=Synchytrium microbalum TaxID=1806994 RepID=A0A507C2Q4_9FUNG|nr:uncharacterized protein SmJEL517_g04515 [Synchytrium microbalum]TPX32364.1 hypothetical protein SmJEL517_g04515 [Synchytrium microbalum]